MDRDVSDITKAPEMLGGRVKTLHPAVHGGAQPSVPFSFLKKAYLILGNRYPCARHPLRS